MKNYSRILCALLLVVTLLFNIASCIPSANPQGGEQTESFYIDGDAEITLSVGESIKLNIINKDNIDGEIIWTSSSSCVSVENGNIVALSEGTAVIKATLGDKVDRVTVNVEKVIDKDDNVDDNNGNGNEEDNNPDEDYVFGSEYDCITIGEACKLAEEYTSSPSSEVYYMVAEVLSILNASNGEMNIGDETGSIYVYKCKDVSGNKISATDLAVGDMIIISGTLRNYSGLLEVQSGTILNYYTPGEEKPTKPDQEDSGNGGNGSDVIIPGVDDPIISDPYVNVDVDAFYANYTPAVSYMDAYYRSKHNLMSGTLGDQDQAPTISSYQPKKDGKYVRNTSYLFSEDKNTYYVVDAYGEIVLEIYKGGAYIMLEEVAAYVFAFGTPPANQSASKDTRPTASPWGEYLRVNNTKFSGNTSKYPYEPVLPRISGCGGDLVYYEMDIGTTGTDCDPSYTAKLYNNGITITRGAARIVYSCQDLNGNKIIDLDERYVFYTYNHYNDFQEYLNYYGGWGEMFGNITGGGTISSKYDYNPTPYVEVYREALYTLEPVVVILYYVPKNEYAA